MTRWQRVVHLRAPSGFWDHILEFAITYGLLIFVWLWGMVVLYVMVGPDW